MSASEIAKHAAGLVSGDRAATHGDKTLNHANIARLWNAYLGCRLKDWSPQITPRDVALMMVLLKVARTSLGAHNPDDYVDAVGYAAIAGEIAAGEQSLKDRVTTAAARLDAVGAKIGRLRDTVPAPGPDVLSQQERDLHAALNPQVVSVDALAARGVAAVAAGGARREARSMTPHERVADAIQRRQDTEGDVEP